MCVMRDVIAGLRKPDSKMYLEAAQQLKLHPTSCIFVDDRYDKANSFIIGENLSDDVLCH
jgi:HAD superfamily hydrolase (TIGR01509 family)